MLVQLKNVLSASQVVEAQQMLEQAEWEDGKNTAGHLAKNTKDNLQVVPGSKIAQTLGNFILARLSQHQVFMAAALPHRYFPPMFNCYQGGGNFGDHIDNAIRYADEARRQPIRTDLSITVFFSEPDSYQGGELIINDTYGNQKLKLAAGDAVLYPSTSLHRVEPVTQGRRLASFFWIQSLIRSDEQRRLLYDLDLSVQALSEIPANQTEVVRLSGIYHNLLRQWAET